MTYTTKARIAAAVVAGLAWAGVLSFMAANAQATGSVAASLWNSSRFLTDWANWMTGIVTLAIVVGHWRLSGPLPTAIATCAVVVVGLLYAGIGGWANLAQQVPDTLARWSDALAHAITPAAMLVAWLFFLRRGTLRWADVPRFAIFPVIYSVQMFARGALGDGYPYPWVDVPQVGWGMALAAAGIAVALFLAVGTLIVALDRRLATKT